MKKIIVTLALLAWMMPASSRAQQSEPLRLVATISLDNVQGRIDHFSADLEGGRLFMSALGNNTVEVFDLRTGKRIHTVPGLHEPQGVYYVPEVNKLFVANGEGGSVEIFDGSSFKLLGEVKFSDDADNLRYDSAARQIYVGYGEGGLGIIDAARNQLLHDIKLEGHPESFQLEKSGPRIFINIPNAREIAVVDRVKRAVVGRWPMDGDRANFPMALDEPGKRLFIVCRHPAAMMVLDTSSGRLVSTLPCVGDADDVWYDAVLKQIYISGGEGFLSVIAQQNANHYEALAKIPTAPGARTSFFAPQLHRLYLAVPRRGNQSAQLRVYEVQTR